MYVYFVFVCGIGGIFCVHVRLCVCARINVYFVRICVGASMFKLTERAYSPGQPLAKARLARDAQQVRLHLHLAVL